jgi:integral membrane protein (TIGR01906 family)
MAGFGSGPAGPERGTGYDALVNRIAGRAGSLVIAVATALVIVAVALPLFLNPVWVAFEQGRADAAAWTGFTESELRTATDAILADLIVGPPDFDVQVAGVPVLNQREQGHMRDVRGVFIGFFALALVLAAAAVAIAARRRGPNRARTWLAVRNGALALIAALVIGGGISFVAFDVLFETFHRLFFAGGSYTFDPATDRLVQLFPFAFWQETAIVVGAVCIVLASVVAWLAGGRAEDIQAAQSPAPALTATEQNDDTSTAMPATTGQSR